MTLPVLGGISGWTRTISNIGSRPANHPVGHARRARRLQRARQLVERCAGSHHVVDQRYALARERAVAAKRAAHVAPARLAVEAGLRRRVALTRARFDFQPPAEMAGNLDRLVVAALAQPLSGKRHGNDAVDALWGDL